MDTHTFSPDEILDALHVPALLTDARARVIQANPDFLSFLPLAHAPCRGQPLSDLLPQTASLVLSCLERHDLRHQSLIQEQAQLFECEISLIKRQGRPVGAMVFLHPLTPADQHGLLHLFKGQQKLAAHLAMIVESSTDGIWVTDGAGTILTINSASAKLNGIDATNYVGKNITTILEKNLVDHSVVQAVLEQKQQVSMNQVIKRTGRHLLVTGSPTFDTKDAISMVVVNERDITELNTLRSKLQSAQQARERAQEKLYEATMDELASQEIVAESKEMRQTVAMASRIGRMGVSNILIQGESGTGKGLMAKFIHNLSPRRDKPFIHINCAALPANLFEAELFGYARGAFTGASEKGKTGLLELARDGTFLFDEVGDIPLEVQAKLLKCIEDKEFYPLGGRKPTKISSALIYATNIDLEQAVQDGRFRKDLYFRINSLHMTIPPLRDRPEDIFKLAESTLKSLNHKYGKNTRLGRRGIHLLQSFDFPGNVRQLISLIKQAVILSEQALLDDFLHDMIGQDLNLSSQHSGSSSLPERLAAVERMWLIQAQEHCTTTREMAEYLGISQPTVVRKLKKHDLHCRDSKMNHNFFSDQATFKPV